MKNFLVIVVFVCASSFVNQLSAQNVNVTFRVDMDDYYVESVVLLGSDWAGWDPAKFQEMTDDDHDHVYELTLSLPAGHSYNYRCKLGGRDWDSFEDLSGGACGSGPAKQDRNIVVPNTDTVLPVYCFGSCTDCATTDKKYLNLRVDMSGETVSADGVHVIGTFNGWNTHASPMTDEDQDQIFEKSVRVSPNPQTYEYKFINGNTYDTEEILFGTCEFRSNRMATVTNSSVTQPTVKFASCTDQTQTLTDLKIGCIGNSITHGIGTSNMYLYSWPIQLRNMLGTGFYVENLGVSGRTMMKTGDFPWWNEPQLKYLFHLQPDIVVIKLGTNDSKTYQWNSTRYKNDYLAMIDTIRTMASKPKIYISTPAKAYSAAYNISDNNIHNAIIPILKQIAYEKNVSLIDMYSATLNMSANFSDGIHPNNKGAEVIAKKVKEILLATKPIISVAAQTLNLLHDRFQWYYEGLPITGASANYYEATKDGHYSVSEKYSQTIDIIVSDTFVLKLSDLGTSKATLQATSANLTTGVDERQGSNDFIYPNPASDYFIIENFQHYDLTIRSLFGNYVKRIFNLDAKTKVDTSGIAKGVYLISLQNKEHRLIKRLVIN
jgi:acyl-CoA thioesterase-1